MGNRTWNGSLGDMADRRKYLIFSWKIACRSFTGQLLSFDIGEQPVFEIPLSNVSQCTTGKNEVTLEFHQNDDAEVSLMEVRFYVPPTQEDGVDPVEVSALGVQMMAEWGGKVMS